MRQSLLYFIAAALFFVATALNVFNDGVNVMTGAGVAVGCAMLVLGLKMRKAGK
jgi:hypothetical protein